jgi:hypothetical protein
LPVEVVQALRRLFVVGTQTPGIPQEGQRQRLFPSS